MSKEINVLENKYYKLIQKLGLSDFYNGVYGIYVKMAELEKNGLKDSEEYNVLVDLIPSVLEIESKKFKNFDHLSSLIIEELISDITDVNVSKMGEVFLDLPNIIKAQNLANETIFMDKTDLYKTDKVRRLISRIRDYGWLRVEPIEFGEDVEAQYDPEQTIQVPTTSGRNMNIKLKELENLGFKYTGDDIPQMTQEELDDTRIANRAIYLRNKLTELLFLKKIEDEIELTENKVVKDALIDYKYNLIYTFLPLENMFANRRSIEGDIYLTKSQVLVSEDFDSNTKKIYRNLYSNFLSNDMKARIQLLKSKEYKGDFPTVTEKLSDRIDVLYLESLVEASIDKTHLESAKMFLNTASKEAKNNVIKKNINNVVTSVENTFKDIDINKQLCKDLKLKR